MPPKDKYANPELRDQIKKELHESDKGGAPGQWSARKAQMMAKEYKDRGGEYNTDPKDKDESQQNLSNWTEEEWQTKEGSGHAKKEDGTEKRYLPKKAWEQMSDKEKEETDKKKQEGSKEGKQHVGNTQKAKNSRKKASKENDKSNRNDNGKAEKDEQEDPEDDDFVEDDENAEGEGEEDGDFQANEDAQDEDVDDDEGEGEEGEQDDDEKDTKAGDKRKAKSQQSNGDNKKQKKSTGKQGNAPPGKVGSKHQDDEEPAPRGSADRLPKEGQKITWKSMPGFVEGKVTEILTEGKEVDGKSVMASKDDPKIVMSSDSSGKICVHKPDACFYE